MLPSSQEHLEEIAKAVENCTVFQRDAVAQAFSRQGYVKRLLDLFSMCDDLENKEGLQALFKIFKAMCASRSYQF